MTFESDSGAVSHQNTFCSSLGINESTDLTINYEFLEQFCEEVLSSSTTIRWVGVTNRLGVILSQKTRASTRLLLTDEENEEYASSAIARQRTRSKFEPKIGRLAYAFGRYDRLLRATIPINSSFFALVTFDPAEKAFDSIITDKICPLIERLREQFAGMET